MVGQRVAHRLEDVAEVPFHSGRSLAERRYSRHPWRRERGGKQFIPRPHVVPARRRRRRGPILRPSNGASHSPRSASGSRAFPPPLDAVAYVSGHPCGGGARPAATRPTVRRTWCSSSVPRRCRRIVARSRSRAASSKPVSTPTCGRPRCARRTRRSGSRPTTVEVVGSARRRRHRRIAVHDHAVRRLPRRAPSARAESG